MTHRSRSSGGAIGHPQRVFQVKLCTAHLFNSMNVVPEGSVDELPLLSNSDNPPTYTIITKDTHPSVYSTRPTMIPKR